MTRFVVDAGVALQLAANETPISSAHELLAPTLIRSQWLSLLHEAVHRGELSDELARQRLERINAMKMRLLGDAVLRRVAWEIADRLGSAETYEAEYIALAKLQGDALVTLDAARARRAEEIVPVASIEALSQP